MIRTAEHLAKLPEGEHKHVTIRSAVLDGVWNTGQRPVPLTPTPPGDLKFIDHLQKKFRNQVGFLPRQALEQKIARGQVSIAFENDEPAAYILGQGNYQRDPSFGIIYQAAVSYDARRRLIGTALVQHFMDHMEPNVRLIGLWCAQDIEANEFWDACGFEAVAARHGSQRKGRVHIFWVGRVQRHKSQRPMRLEPLRFPNPGNVTRGGLMRERRQVYEVQAGQAYSQVVLPEYEDRGLEAHATHPQPQPLSRRERGVQRKLTLLEQQRAFIHGASKHICIVVRGVTKWVPVAPFDVPDFADLARVVVAPGKAA